MNQILFLLGNIYQKLKIICVIIVLFLVVPARVLLATTSCAESQAFIGFSADESRAYWEEVIGGECVPGKALHQYDFRSGKSSVEAEAEYDEGWEGYENDETLNEDQKKAVLMAKLKRENYARRLNEIKTRSKNSAEALLFCEGKEVFVHKDSYLGGDPDSPWNADKGYLNKKFDLWFVVSEECNIGDSYAIGGRCDYNGVYLFKKEACREANFKFSFKSYPVKEIFSAAPKQINWKSHPKAKMFRSNLEEVQNRRPNFAGHYLVVKWGCGSPCAEIALIDAKTGNVSMAPFFTRVGESYRIDSRLFIVNPKPSPLFDTEYYLWDGNKFVELGK